MASVVVTATNVVVALTPPGALVAPAIRNSKNKPKSVTIDNQGSVNPHNIEIWDSFTPDASNAVAAPVWTTVRRHRISLIAADVIVLEKNDLEGVECLGNLSILADALDVLCLITVGYEAE